MEEQDQPRPNRLRAGARLLMNRLRKAIPFASGVAASLAALLLYNALFPPPAPLSEREFNDQVSAVLASATPPPAYASLVYQVIQPSLVLIQSTGVDEDGEATRSLGSGVVIDDMGDILTSLHVVSDAVEIQLTFADGTQSLGQVISAQPENDIAVLQALTPPSVIIPAVLGNPNAMRIGDEAYAVGNPFGLYGSMSAGVISGFDRSFHSEDNNVSLEGLIQIDSAVNPGNSGGPLLNRSGHVVGIIVGILNPTDDEFFIGIGFAVPITVAGGAAGSPPY